MDSSQPVRLSPTQKAQAAQVLTRAFQDDPVYTYIFSDSQEQSRLMPRLWEAVVHCSLVYGEAYTTPDLNGVACWLSPGQTEMTLWRMLRTGMVLPRAVLRLGVQSRRRALQVVTYTDKIRHSLQRQRFWYLWALAVEPTCQHEGIGGKLIQPILTRADQQGLPCYLETQTEKNVAFYQHRGFKVISQGEVPGTELKIWAMLRDSQAVITS